MTYSIQPVSSEDLNLREESLRDTVRRRRPRYPQNLKTFDATGRIAVRSIDRLELI